MKRINTLGLLAVAAMAIAAFIGTSSASATTPGSFTSTGGAQNLKTTVVKQHVFTVTGSQVTCKKVEFAGATTAEKTTAQKVTPSYKECTAFGFAATVTNLGCDIELTATTNVPNGHAEAHMVNSPGKTCEGFTILVDNVFAKCHVDVTKQSVGGIHYVNQGTPPNEDVLVQVTASGMTDHVTTSTGLCPLTVGTHTNATYTGEETVQGEVKGIAYDEE